MKALASFLVLLFMSTLGGYGKAYFYTRSELIGKATVIAIVTIAAPEASKPVDADPFAAEGGVTGKLWTYGQQAKVRVEKVIKGEIPYEFVMHGKESFICAQCVLSEGRFLAFLAKDGEMWVGANWHLSLRRIENGKADWYVSEEQRYPLEPRKLEEVVAEIEEALAKP
jgi:hypothetical protein